MANFSLQLRSSFTSATLKAQLFPHFHRLKLTPIALPALLSSTSNAAAVTGPIKHDAVVRGTLPGNNADDDSIQLPAGLQRELMPNHVAIIMDGNRRWAVNRSLPTGLGYEAGARALRRLVKLCCKWGSRFSLSSLSHLKIGLDPKWRQIS